MDQAAEYLCGQCGLQVTEEEASIQCENECMLWFHVACTKATPSGITVSGYRPHEICKI